MVSTVKNVSWIITHAIYVAAQLIRCGYLLGKVQMPAVTIWGGTRANQDDAYAQKAFTLAQQCVRKNISILTGGGPGIMEAANCGAASESSTSESGKKVTAGIGVVSVDAEYDNPCVSVIRVDYFFIRKWLLIRNSIAFVIFPGGIGTADELFELLNFMKHDKVPKLPIVLIGVAYWQPLIDWMHNSAVAHDFIKSEWIDSMVVTDDLERALGIIQSTVDSYREYVKK